MDGATDFWGERVAARRRQLANWGMLSLALHAGLVAFGLSLPASRFAMPPNVISVDLVSLPRSEPRSQPIRARRPEPAARVEPVVKKAPREVVLPKRPSADPARTRREPRSRPAPIAPVEQDYDDVLAQLREEAGETAPTPRPEPRVASAVPSKSMVTASVSPEVAAWMRSAKAHVRRSWVVPPGFRTQDLETHVRVRLDRQGRVGGNPEIVRGSGNPWYDEGVVRAILKASPLPPPPQADVWAFIFVPEDSL